MTNVCNIAEAKERYQVENAPFTRIVSAILDDLILADLSKREYKIVLAVIRKTYGYRKPSDRITEQNFAAMTGIDERNVRRTLSSLLQRNILIREGGKRGKLRYNKYVDSWREQGQNSPIEKNANRAKTALVNRASLAPPRKEKRKGLTNVNPNPPYSPPPRGGHAQQAARECDFERFWIEYPKKRSKAQARKAWNKLRPNEQLQAEILAGLQRAKTSFDWQKQGGQFVPYPASWLNAEGWLDEIEERNEPHRRNGNERTATQITADNWTANRRRLEVALAEEKLDGAIVGSG